GQCGDLNPDACVVFAGDTCVVFQDANLRLEKPAEVEGLNPAECGVWHLAESTFGKFAEGSIPNLRQLRQFGEPRLCTCAPRF
ncbi:MAG: hypothetical protein J0I13_00125, partial [Rhizobiales bacterium]|nr:hypothetical protein [Hyphomicrobiales bacterium]